MSRGRKEPTHKIMCLRAVRERRISLGLTLEKVGFATGYWPDHINRWEHAKAFPSIVNFEALVNALGGQLKIEWGEP